MKEFHVSLNGDDSNGGNNSDPFATLDRARDAYRATEDEKGMIVVHEGEYYETELELGPEDSGLCLKASPGEKVRLYGGRKISGWTRDEDGLVSVELPEVKNGNWNFRALVVNDRLAERARFPEVGRFEHEDTFDVTWMSTTDGGWEREPTREELTTLHYKEGDLGSWLDPANAEVTIYHQWDESTVGVEAVDVDAGCVKLSEPAGHPPGAFANPDTGAGLTYVIRNVRKGMKHPGQWYLDRKQGKLFYWPRPEEDVADLHVVAPITKSVIRVEGTEEEAARGITIEGFQLGATTTDLKAGGFAAREYAGAISGRQCYSVSVVNTRVRASGGHGIRMRNCPGTAVKGCELSGLGAGGIYVNGRDSEVLNCSVRDIGRAYSSAVGMHIGSMIDVRHNKIVNVPYSGIVASGGRATIIAKNVIEDVMQELHDGAAIYVSFCHGYRIQDNIARSINGSRAHAYYLDEQVTKSMVEGNLAVNCSSPCHNHMATDNSIRNNMFVSDNGMRVVFMKCEDFTFERNVLEAEGDILFSHMDAVGSMKHNVIYSRSGEVLELETRDDDPAFGQPLDVMDNMTAQDPELSESEKGHWESKRGDLLQEYGIQTLDVGDAGPGRSEE